MKLLLFGVVVLIFPIVSPTNDLYANGVQTAGVVKSFSKGLLGRRTYELVVEYRDASQQAHELSTTIRTLESIFRNYEAGKSVIVAYDSNNPSHADLYT